MTTILAGDIGGTKTTLALYRSGGTAPFAVKQPLRQATFASADSASFEAIVTGFLAVAVALVSHGIWTAVIMLGVVLLVQQAESNLLQPLLMSRSLKLHPVAVLLTVAAGTIVAGIIGLALVP